jgi:hypothetical protein
MNLTENYLVNSKNNPSIDISRADFTESNFNICGIFSTKHMPMVIKLNKSANCCNRDIIEFFSAIQLFCNNINMKNFIKMELRNLTYILISESC